MSYIDFQTYINYTYSSLYTKEVRKCQDVISSILANSLDLSVACTKIERKSFIVAPPIICRHYYSMFEITAQTL